MASDTMLALDAAVRPSNRTSTTPELVRRCRYTSSPKSLSHVSLLLTCDKDFGELVYRQRLTNSGVVLVRLEGLTAASKASIVSDAMMNHGSEMKEAFTVVSPGLLRIRHPDSPPA